MPIRELTVQEIEDFITQDKIVWVGCLDPKLKPTQGKFVKGKEPYPDGEYPYSFCPYQKGVNLPFLPACCWIIDDAEFTRPSLEDALAAALKKRTGKK